jgi:sugar phosphate isomerase/epimerase
LGDNMKNYLKWGTAGVLFPNSAHSEIIKTCRYAGFSSVEAGSGFVSEKTEQELEGIKKQYGQEGIKLESLHLPFGVENDVSSFYETRRRNVVESMKKMFVNASVLGSRVLILHPSAGLYSISDEGIEKYLYSFSKSLETLIPYAEGMGLAIAVENLAPVKEGHCFCSDPEHFNLLKNRFSSPGFGFCLDTGHAFLSGGQSAIREYFDVMSPNIRAFHLQDNSGDRDLHLAPGRGLIKWEEIFANIIKMNFRSSLCIEAPPFSPSVNQKYDLNSWKVLVSELNAFVEKTLKA